MPDQHFIIREPLLNPQERVLGYALAWQAAHVQTSADYGSALRLLQFIVEQLPVKEGEAMLGDELLFLEIPDLAVLEGAVELLSPTNVVLVLPAEAARDEAAAAAMSSAHAMGFELGVRGAAQTLPVACLNEVSYLELDAAAPEFVSLIQHWRSANLMQLRLMARGVKNWATFDACAAAGILVFGSHLQQTSRPSARVRELNPAQALILQLMDMVRQNVEVKQLEAVLKRDAALSYKLLRYINSAGFGLGCEIQSLKHAVTMLGYSPLYRWLALLLATATTSGYSPVLMQTAVIRGRFAELLGADFLPRQEADNLFVAGMFSLLDQLLGVPMEKALEKIQLPESVTQALLCREGIFGPFLALAEACERPDADLDGMTTSLCISPRDVNQAQLTALAWAQTLKL